MILYFYIVAAAAITVILDKFFPIFRESYSWYAAPLTVIGIVLALIIVHIAILVVWIVLVNLEKPAKESRVFRKMIAMFLQMAFHVAGVRVHTTGLEKIPQNERFLLVCNHTHNLDPAVILHSISDCDLAFIAKQEVRQLYPFVYKALHKMHGLPIDRENNREAAKTIINAVKLIREDKNSIALFPEGYTSKDGNLQPIRNGSLKIATKSGAKIVVCTLVGADKIAKNMFRRRCDVYLDVVEVIETENNSRTAELGDMVSTIMQKSLDARRQNILKD